MLRGGRFTACFNGASRHLNLWIWKEVLDAALPTRKHPTKPPRAVTTASKHSPFLRA
ncbi:hypothetical protein JRQ81_008303 [Phrynocephalus forsythii]|uniref:Uncharacterized protein n=1 Tax=Phrynocephalus forsythii TaxID=171643 RepID=A0A9Q0XDJ8_9SAUR|nr:hypothetical protein JRQ81_008303 [Phrynocephalus forsythii]